MPSPSLPWPCWTCPQFALSPGLGADPSLAHEGPPWPVLLSVTCKPSVHQPRRCTLRPIADTGGVREDSALWEGAPCRGCLPVSCVQSCCASTAAWVLLKFDSQGNNVEKWWGVVRHLGLEGFTLRRDWAAFGGCSSHHGSRLGLSSMSCPYVSP